MILGNIPYLNTAPYFHFLSPRWLKQHSLIAGNPRQLGEMARAGKLDAGLLSLMDFWDLEKSGKFEALGSLGIAGSGRIQSILLFGVKDPKTLEGKAIGVTDHTATSSRLMEVWLKEKVGIKQYQSVAPSKPSAATLLIGDQALSRKLKPLPGEPEPIDLSQAWKDWTGLPFVFARWALRKNLPDPEKRELFAALSSALDLGLDDLGEVCERRAEDSAFEAGFIQEYLAGIVYRIGPEEEKGMALFKEKAAKYNA